MFTGKHLSWSLFLIKLQSLKACNFIKKRLQHRCFCCEFCDIFENNLFYRIPLVAAFRVNRRCPLWKLLEACNFIKKEATKELEKQSSKVFYKKDVLKNFTKFTEKHLCHTFFTTFLKKRLWHRCFPVNLVKFSRTPSFIEHVRWLLLEFINIFETLQLGLTFFIVTFFFILSELVNRKSPCNVFHYNF